MLLVNKNSEQVVNKATETPGVSHDSEVINWYNLWKAILLLYQKSSLKPGPMTHLIMEMFIRHLKKGCKQ